MSLDVQEEKREEPKHIRMNLDWEFSSTNER
jgi:hypothetical protein